MGAEIGDSVVCDGRAGEVVDLIDGRAIVRPFPIAEQQNTPGPPGCFTATGEVVILKKHFDRTTSGDVDRERLEAQARARNEAIRARHYEAAARADRAWYRERERSGAGSGLKLQTASCRSSAMKSRTVSR